MRKLLITFLLIPTIANANVVQKAGDILQFANPIIGLWLTTHDNNDTAYILNYLIAMGGVGLGKHCGTKMHYKGSRRPDRTAYTGMPSGHTTSSWLPAAFTRNPYLYAGAALTAVSRVHCKKHYWYQVLASIAISEGIVALNQRFNVSVLVLNDGFSLSMVWRA